MQNTLRHLMHNGQFYSNEVETSFPSPKCFIPDSEAVGRKLLIITKEKDIDPCNTAQNEILLTEPDCNHTTYA